MGRLVVAAGDRGLLGFDLFGDRVEPRGERAQVALGLLTLARVELKAGEQQQLIAMLVGELAADCRRKLAEGRRDVLLLLLGAGGQRRASAGGRGRRPAPAAPPAARRRSREAAGSSWSRRTAGTGVSSASASAASVSCTPRRSGRSPVSRSPAKISCSCSRCPLAPVITNRPCATATGGPRLGCA